MPLPIRMSTPKPATNLDHDSLAQALAWLTRHHGRERSVASLLSELTVDGLLQPEQALRALQEAGYEAGLLSRQLGEIHALLMPAVLLLNEGEACILLGRQGEGPRCDSHRQL